MSRWRPIAETIHLTALGLWLGAVVTAGAAAATVFPTMKALDPRLPAYAGYTGEHWMIAAGHVAAKVFLIVDMVQFACATLAILTMGVLLFVCRLSLRRRSARVRVLALVLGVAILAFYSIYLAPRMQLNMRGYWEAALAGNNVEALKFREIFSSDHPLASWLMKGTAASVLLALVAGAWSAATSGAAAPPEAPARKPARYEEPGLLRGRR